MSDFCDFVPDDPSCVTAPATTVDSTQLDTATAVTTIDPVTDTSEPVIDDEPNPEPNTKIEEDLDMSKLDPFQGQVAYTLVALTSLASIALEMFRYRSPTDFYTSSDSVYGDMNWWKLSHLIGGYGGLSFFAVASVTQILSMAGIAVPLNMLVWEWGAFMILPVLGAITSAALWYAYDQAYTVKIGTDATKAAAASVLMGSIENEGAIMIAKDVAIAFELVTQYANWIHAQESALTAEEKLAREKKAEESEEKQQVKNSEGGVHYFDNAIASYVFDVFGSFDL